MSTFCRHNRFVAECPICSKGTVLDPNRTPERRPRPATVRRKGAKRPVQAASGLRVSRGEFASAGPYEDGREVLQEIKSDDALKRIPVVVLTTSKAEEDVLRTYNLHANCYVTKPVDLEKFIVVVKSIDVFWLTVVTLPPHGH